MTNRQGFGNLCLLSNFRKKYRNYEGRYWGKLGNPFIFGNPAGIGSGCLPNTYLSG